MEAASYIAKSTQNLRESVEHFTDEVEGQLERRKVCGVYLTRKVVLSIVGTCAFLAIILGVTLGATLSKKSDGSSGYREDHRYWSIGQTLESSVGTSIFDGNTTEYQALMWLAQHDQKRLDVSSPIETLTQRFAVANLYFALGGNDWNSQYNFLSGKHECDWNDGTSGVFCDNNNNNGHFVTKLLLSSSNLKGMLPRDIGLLKYLHHWDMKDNTISGSVPDSIGILTNLRLIELSKNQLKGPIPASIIMLKKLEHCDLSNNEFEGDSHSLLEQLPSLVGLNLASNQFVGTLGKLGDIATLEMLWFDNNQLSSFPEEFGPGSSLKEVHLVGNEMRSPLPADLFAQMQALELFDASENQLTGALSSSIGQASNLQILKLNNNNLQQGLPPGLGRLSSNLGILELTGNGFSNTIPTWIGQLKNLEILNLNDNQLSGSLPSEFGELSGLERLNLSNNKLGDKLPPEMGRMQNMGELLLADNGFDGTIPTEWANLFLLDTLDISSTHLFADMDEALCGPRPQWGATRAIYKVDCLLEAVICTCATECCDGTGYCCDVTGDAACELEPDI